MRFRNILLLVLLLSAVGVIAAPSPWDSWRAGYTNFEQGESLRERGRYSEAVVKFEQARQNYLAVRSARPDWNQRVIADRIRDCETQLAEMRRLLGGGKSSSTPEETVSAEPVETVVVQPSASADAGEYQRVKQEVFKLRAELAKVKQELGKQRNFEAEISALIRDRRIAEEKLALLEKRYAALQKEQNVPGNAASELEQRLVQEKMDSERFRLRAEAGEQQLAELQNKLRDFQLRVNASENKLKRTEDELKRKESELDRLKNSPGTSVSIAHVPQKGDKKDEIAVVVTQNRRLQDELSRRERELDMLRDELRRERAAAQVGATELANIRERSKNLEKDVKLYSDRVKDLQSRLERRDSDDYRAAAAAKDTRVKLENELLALQKELVAFRNNSDAGKKAQEDAERKIKSLEAEILNLRSGVMERDELKNKLAAVEKSLRQKSAELSKIQRDFTALTAENRENRLLAEAAKPREKELENAKLRLLELDRLKGELAKEQQLAGELKSAYSKAQQELRKLRTRTADFDNIRRRMVELEAAAKEVSRLKQLEKELDNIRGRESELAKLKIQLGDAENNLRRKEAAVADMQNQLQVMTKEVTALKNENLELVRLRRVNGELKALIANQSGELDQLKKQLEKNGKKSYSDDDGRIKQLAAQLGPLNDKIQQLQSELAGKEETFASRLSKLTREVERRTRELTLRERELAELKKLNTELANYKQHSADELRNKVDISRISRLEDELSALNRLNAELSAERDRLLAEKEAQNSAAPTVVLTKVSPEQAASSGVIAESDGNMELAIWNYRQALAADANFAPAHLRLGTILFDRGNYAEAIAHLSAALAADPANLALALTVARCQLRLQRFGNARTVIEPLLVRHPDNAYVLMCAALIDAGTGKSSQAEERLIAAGRLAPESAEIKLELARLLANSVTDRKGEAALAYEAARRLGAAPEPQLEKTLGTLLDHRREIMRFMSGAAIEAEVGKDWHAAVWYYKKLIAEKHLQFVPCLALAQWRSGNVAGAKETLEFHPPSRNGMVVRALIALSEKDEAAAMRAARQSAGAKIAPEWAAMTAELARLQKEKSPSAAVKVLLQGITRK